MAIWQGGSDDPTIRSISVRNIYRVAQLYPKTGQSLDQIAGMMHAGWGGIRVGIEHLLATPEDIYDSLSNPATLDVDDTEGIYNSANEESVSNGGSEEGLILGT